MPSRREIESAYRAALLRVRRQFGAINAEMAQKIAQALTRYAVSLERVVAADRGALFAAELVRRAAQDFSSAVQAAIAGGRDLSYETVQRIYADISRRLVLSEIPGRLFGTVRLPPLAMLGQFESLQAAQTWRTLITLHSHAAAQEATTIIREGLLRGIGADELASRLRRYVVGAEPFQTLFERVPMDDGTFEKIDLRSIPSSLRGAARQMQYNAARIAFSETRNARTEAEVSAFAADPATGAVQWALSPKHVRGGPKAVDVCDVMAESDWFGLGPGVYPVNRVPPPPHPWCECERLPVIRPFAEWTEAKPDPALQLQPDEAIPDRADELTPGQLERIQAQAAGLLNWGARAAAAAGA